MSDPKNIDDLEKLKVNDLRKLLKTQGLAKGTSNMKKAQLVNEIVVSKWWLEKIKKPKQRQDDVIHISADLLPKQSFTMDFQDMSRILKQDAMENPKIQEEGGEDVEVIDEKPVEASPKKSSKIVDNYYNINLVNDYYTIIGKSLIPYERSGSNLTIDKYYAGISQAIDDAFDNIKGSLILKSDPNGLVKLTGKIKKTNIEKGVEEKPVEKLTEVKEIVEELPMPKLEKLTAKTPVEFEIVESRTGDAKTPPVLFETPKPLQIAEPVKTPTLLFETPKPLQIAEPVKTLSSSSSSSSIGVKDILSDNQYVSVIKSLKNEFELFKNRIDNMLSLY